MGTSGVPFKPDRHLLICSIKKYKGVIAHIAEAFHVDRGTLRKYVFKDPELSKLLEEERADWVDDLCDLAEGTLLYTVAQREDLMASLRATQFVLNNHGRKRGYTPPGAHDDGKAEAEKVAAQATLTRVIDAISAKAGAQPIAPIVYQNSMQVEASHREEGDHTD